MDSFAEKYLYSERKIRKDFRSEEINDQSTNGLAPRIHNFVVRQIENEQKWIIEFFIGKSLGNNYTQPTYRLSAKRGGVRKFARLSGVLAWMKKIGIREFKVVLSDLN